MASSIWNECNITDKLEYNSILYILAAQSYNFSKKLSLLVEKSISKQLCYLLLNKNKNKTH